MSRYIDADALIERFAEMQRVKPDKDGREYACNFRNMGGEPSVEWFAVEDAVENAPTVDAVPVVRCRECKHQMTCGFVSARPYKLRADWFCADGERKDGEE